MYKLFNNSLLSLASQPGFFQMGHIPFSNALYFFSVPLRSFKIQIHYATGSWFIREKLLKLFVSKMITYYVLIQQFYINEIIRDMEKEACSRISILELV